MKIKPITNFVISNKNEVGNHISYKGDGYMEFPIINDTVVNIRGWGLINDGNGEKKLPNTFFICLDTKVIGKCTPNIERYDVIESLCLENELLLCGFEASFEIEDVTGILNALTLHLSDNKNGLVPLPGPYACILPESPLQEPDENEEYIKIDRMHTICCQLTSKCNLRCKYCFITSDKYEEGEITAPTLSKFLQVKEKYSISLLSHNLIE